jgi:hypothetical protein
MTQSAGGAPTPGARPTRTEEPRDGRRSLPRLAVPLEACVGGERNPHARTSGGYWHHERRAGPASTVHDEHFQDQLLEALARFTATRLV